MEAMCFERLMSGSQQHLEREAKMLEVLASMLGEDGLQWVKSDIKKKPWMQIPEPFAMVHGQGRMMTALIAWYQYTGDPAWKERIDRMVDGMDKKLVVHKGDYAYIPVYGYYEAEYLRSCYTPKGWKDTVEPTNEKF
jgi:mannose/cellobiose epimerase-like protein (N-acyl-D-glucosamine 2-epimerase family)